MRRVPTTSDSWRVGRAPREASFADNTTYMGKFDKSKNTNHWGVSVVFDDNSTRWRTHIDNCQYPHIIVHPVPKWRDPLKSMPIEQIHLWPGKALTARATHLQSSEPARARNSTYGQQQMRQIGGAFLFRNISRTL